MEPKFKIFDRQGRGRNNTRRKYKDKVFFTLSNSQIRIYPNLINKLKFKVGSEILLAESENKYYFGDVTMHNFKKGYTLQSPKTKNILICNSIRFVKRGLIPGVYILTGEIVYDKANNIDWYELEYRKS